MMEQVSERRIRPRRPEAGVIEISHNQVAVNVFGLEEFEKQYRESCK